MRPILKLLIVILFIVIHPILSTSVEGGHKTKVESHNREHTKLNAIVNLKGGIYLNNGHPVGFHLELLNKFARHQRYEIRVAPLQEGDPWEKLLTGECDILIIDATNDTIPAHYKSRVISGTKLNNNNQVWVVKTERYNMLQSMNHWFGYYKNSDEYRALENKYYRTYRRITSLHGPVTVLSPYDHIIKEHAKTLGWDWRLLASLIYQESRFKVSARSNRNAHGLMQLLPSTAKVYNVEDLYDPHENIRAGTLFIQRLQSIYDNQNIDSLNRVKFVLAAYNAGEGRVNDIQRVAQHMEVDQYQWDSLKIVIPHMNIKGELPDTLLRHGSFKGVETINFVDDILNRYENYKALVKK